MEALVLYPIPAIGHVISMVELGKLILTSKPSLSIHILISDPPYNSGDTGPYIAAVSAAVPSITFHRLPPVPLPPELRSSSPNLETLIFELLRRNNPLVSEALTDLISGSHTVHAFVMDFFCGSTLDVAADLGVPSYYFFTSGVSALSSFLYFPTLHRSLAKSYKDLGENYLLQIPGVLPIPATEMPKPLVDRNDMSYKYFLESATYFPRATGIIVNSFEALEPRVVKAIKDGQCVPDGPTPRIHCIGPLIHNSDSKTKSNQERCLTWLDSQPNRSVVFLCFGSLGLFSAEQLLEIAIGLEKSGERFLWVVRNPPLDENINLAAARLPDPDIEELLPGGFLERTRDRGLVVKNWAPQVDVLSHSSVGGFVTHCGLNSVLESVSAGVPMVAWPLYAEQRLNRVVLVEEIRIALPMNDDEDGFVGASEVERRVTELMASPGVGDSVRARAR